MKKEKLRPTLWRTCRAMMNPTRLNMMRIAFATHGELCVRDFARALSIPDSIASIYLRQLNSRGLLGVRRERLKVFYNTESDRSLPDAVVLQRTFAAYFATEPNEGWETEVMTTLRAFSHFNRLAILQRLSKGPAELDELFRAMGVCVKSVFHHLGFLSAAGLVEVERHCHRPAYYRLGTPRNVFARTLLGLMLEGGVSYYNEGTGNGPDGASRKVLRKIRKSEGIGRGNWQETGPMKSRRHRLTSEERKALLEA